MGKKNLKRELKKVKIALIRFDRKCNVFFAPLLNFIFRPEEVKFGDKHQTISTVFSLNRHCCKLCGIMCTVLHWIDPSHCENSHKTDLREKHENERF